MLTAEREVRMRLIEAFVPLLVARTQKTTSSADDWSAFTSRAVQNWLGATEHLVLPPAK